MVAIVIFLIIFITDIMCCAWTSSKEDSLQKIEQLQSQQYQVQVQEQEQVWHWE